MQNQLLNQRNKLLELLLNMMSVVLLVLVVVLLIEMVLRPDPLPFYRRFGCPIVYSLGPVFVKVPTGSSAGGPYNSMGSSEPKSSEPTP